MTGSSSAGVKRASRSVSERIVLADKQRRRASQTDEQLAHDEGIGEEHPVPAIAAGRRIKRAQADKEAETTKPLRALQDHFNRVNGSDEIAVRKHELAMQQNHQIATKALDRAQAHLNDYAVYLSHNKLTAHAEEIDQIAKDLDMVRYQLPVVRNRLHIGEGEQNNLTD